MSSTSSTASDNVEMNDTVDLTNVPSDSDNDNIIDNETKSVELAAQYKADGNTYYQRAQYDTAINLYSKAIELQPNDPTYYNNRSAAYVMISNYEQALNDSLKAIELEPLSIKPYSRAAKCYNSSLNLAQSRNILQQCVAAHQANNMSTPAQIESDLYDIDIIEKKYNQVSSQLHGGTTAQECKAAISTIQSLMTQCSDALQLKLLMIEFMIKIKQYTNAQTVVNICYNNNKTNSEVIRLRGSILYYLSDLVHAQQHFTECLKLDPDNTKARTLLKLVKRMNAAKQSANELYTSGKHDEAISAYTELLSIDPHNDHFNSTIYCNRAAAHMKLLKFGDAVADCSRAISLNREYKKAWERKITCLIDVEAFDDAMRSIENYESIGISTEKEIHEYKQKIQIEKKKSGRKNYYKILQVDKHASDSEIKKGYRKMALVYHPDKATGDKTQAEEKFKDVNEAYEILSDPKRKARYDAGVDIDQLNDEGHGHGHGGHDMNDVFARMFTQQQRGYGGGMGGFGY